MALEFDINEFEQNPGKNYVIDASAGTGKTYTIVEMVKRLLKNGITLDKVLIVTYTDKAAGELKDRIRAALNEIPDEKIKNAPENDVDHASIGTIHSFCRNIITEFFISAGKPSCQKLIDESAIKEFLKRYIREGKIYDDICTYKKVPGNEVEENRIINLISVYIEKYYLDFAGQVDSSIIRFISFAEIAKNIYKEPNVQAAIEILSQSNVPKIKAFAEYIRQNESVDYGDFRYNEKKMTAAGLKTDPEKEAYKIIKGAMEILKKVEVAYNDPLCKIVYDHLPQIYMAWQKEKETLCEQTFNDMIRNVREEVRKPQSALLNKIRGKYTYAIIDEFQDTNRKQWDIFKTAFLCEGHHILVVGDPKQSIYSFQGADVTVYSEAKEEIEKNGGYIRSLKRNYRATGTIIESTNQFFNKTENPAALPENMEFEDSDVGNKNFAAQYKGEDIKAFWITDGDVSEEEYAEIVCNRIVDFCTVDDGKTRLQIWDKDGKQHSVSFKDFAVLARTRSEMVPIRNVFRRCGIPYSQYKDTDLFSGKECANWRAVLEAVNVPDFTGRNREYFRKAMFTDFFGYSFDDIRSSDFDKDSMKEIELFTNWRELVRDREWAKLIERIFADTDVAAKLQSLGDMRSFGIFMQIGDYCVDYLTRVDDLDMLIKNLRKQALNSNDEDEGKNEETGSVARSTDSDCVQMMTIHASKGLEFPVVISVAGFKDENRQAINAFTYHSDGKNYLSFCENDLYRQEKWDEFRRLYYVAYTRAKYLLMLPCYRHESNKPIPFVKSLVSNPIYTYKRNHPDGYEAMPLKDDTKSPEDLIPPVKDICSRSSSGKKLSPDDFYKRIDTIKNGFGKNIYYHTSQKHAYSSLSHGGEKHTALIENDRLKIDNDEETVSVGLSGYDQSAKVIGCSYDAKTLPIKLSSDFIAGTGIGNVLHRVFEQVDYTKEDPDMDKRIEDCFAEEKIRCKAEWITDVRKMVHNVRNACLPIIRGNEKGDGCFSLKEIDFANRRNEAEFNYNIPAKKPFSHYMNGFVDLIIRREDYYAVLDWKSDRLNDNFTCYNDGKEIKKHVDELYSIQRVLYSYCLIKWLKQFYPDKTEQEIFTGHFGGVYYVFLRGCHENTGNGIYAQTWESFGDLEKEYKEMIERRV